MNSQLLPDYCTPGRALASVDGLVVHYFSAANVDAAHQYELEACWRLLCDLNRAREEREWYMQTQDWPAERMFASAHVLIDRAGEALRLVDFDREAWHAGASILNGRHYCNKWTLGIELIGGNTSGFTDAQYATLAEISAGLMRDHDFSDQWIAGHDSVRWAALEAGRNGKPKYDPSGRKDGQGNNFDWPRFRAELGCHKTTV